MNKFYVSEKEIRSRKASSEGGLDSPYQDVPSFLGSFSSKGQSVMSEGPTFDHSARLEPAIPALQVLES